MITDEKLAILSILDWFGHERREDALRWIVTASELGIVPDGIIQYGGPEDPFTPKEGIKTTAARLNKEAHTRFQKTESPF